MFDHMNVELANQHRKSIMQDAENYRKIVAAQKADGDRAQQKTRTGEVGSAGLIGRLGNWLEAKIWKPLIGRFHPRISH